MKSTQPKPKLINKWIEWVKNYAIDNDMSYRDALKSPLCKSTYLNLKTSQ